MKLSLLVTLVSTLSISPVALSSESLAASLLNDPHGDTFVGLSSVSTFSSSTLTTLFAANNNGNNGGAVYFNIETGANPIAITGLTTNTEVADSDPTDGFQVYTRVGTAQGFELNIAAWSLGSTGTITPSGFLNDPSPVVLNNSIELNANTLYGFALIMPSNINHGYTDGTCTAYIIEGNCFSTNADLTFIGGSASNVPFEGSLLQPRIWNGSITYDVQLPVIPEPTSILSLVAVGTALLMPKGRCLPH